MVVVSNFNLPKSSIISVVSKMFFFYFWLTLSTLGIRAQGTGAGTKNVGVDKKSTSRVDVIIFCIEIIYIINEHTIKYSQSNFHRDKVNSKPAARLFYRPLSIFFFGISKLNNLYFTAVNDI